MTLPDHEYDPDDNFADPGEPFIDVDEDTALETLVWQLLLLINPEDEESALQQFGAWQEMLAESIDGDVQPLDLLRDVIDWKSGFHVDAADVSGLVECIGELASRWNLRIDWGVDDVTDEAFMRDVDIGSLLALAHQQLREHGYSLWTWNPRGQAQEDIYAGWMTLRRDDEAMMELAQALDVELRPGNAH